MKLRTFLDASDKSVILVLQIASIDVLTNNMLRGADLVCIIQRRVGALHMSDYEKLKEFWNSNKVEPERIEGRWVEDEVFDRVVSQGLRNAELILDYGCGFGWGLFEMSFMAVSRKALELIPPSIQSTIAVGPRS